MISASRQNQQDDVMSTRYIIEYYTIQVFGQLSTQQKQTSSSTRVTKPRRMVVSAELYYFPTNCWQKPTLVEQQFTLFLKKLTVERRKKRLSWCWENKESPFSLRTSFSWLSSRFHANAVLSTILGHTNLRFYYITYE